MTKFNHFDLVAPVYERFIKPIDPNQLVSLAGLPVAGLLLDAGGGTGRISYSLKDSVKGIVIAFGRSDTGIEFDAMDHKPVNLFFLIAAPEDAIGAHLNVMARLSFLMKAVENRQKLMEAASPGDVLALVDKID